MKKQTLSIYTQFRKAGYRACEALHNARIIAKFRKLEASGRVRITAEYEHENYFDVYGEPDTKKERETIIHMIETHGLWYVKSEKACKGCHKFDTVDGIGMVIASDPTDPIENPHIIDLMAAALN